MSGFRAAGFRVSGLWFDKFVRVWGLGFGDWVSCVGAEGTGGGGNDGPCAEVSVIHVRDGFE